MVELRKRPAPQAAPPPAKKKAAPKSKARKDEPVAEPVTDDAIAEAAKEKVEEVAEKSSKAGPPKQGDSIDLSGFGGEIETNDGEKTTLAKLVESSKAGVVLFTYPKASTPGCKTMASTVRETSVLM